MNETTEASRAGANLYAAPGAEQQLVRAPPADMLLASKGQRFCTLLLDYVGMTLGDAAVHAVLATSGIPAEWASSIVNVGVGFAYYLTFEGAFGRTPGKMIVGTRVVDSAGYPPTFAQLVGRTACRFIPFEMFSFLGQTAAGWHDRWSSTRVIRSRE